jgi:hypothetical protein
MYQPFQRMTMASSLRPLIKTKQYLMKHNPSIYGLLIMTVLACSCQKVINVKLNPDTEKYVIEGVITDQPGGCSVSITHTKNFSDDNNFPGISGAIVTIENKGVITTLTETTPGVYTSTTITGTPGNTYAMKVNIEGTIYTASSTMPQPIGLDTLYISTQLYSTDKYATITYKDPPGVPNYYRFVQYVNGLKEKSIFLNSDEFSDGLTVTGQLSFNNDNDDKKRDIHTGDSVKIDMYCIDAAVYKYWFSLNSQATGDGNSASPANPVSNIQGGCMGYFSAQTLRSKAIVAP